MEVRLGQRFDRFSNGACQHCGFKIFRLRFHTGLTSAVRAGQASMGGIIQTHRFLPLLVYLHPWPHTARHEELSHPNHLIDRLVAPTDFTMARQ
jgi:hypothetical protein